MCWVILEQNLLSSFLQVAFWQQVMGPCDLGKQLEVLTKLSPFSLLWHETNIYFHFYDSWVFRHGCMFIIKTQQETDQHISHRAARPQLSQLVSDWAADCEGFLAVLFSKSSKDKMIFKKHSFQSVLAIKLFPCNNLHLAAVPYYAQPAPAGSPAHQAVHRPPPLPPSSPPTLSPTAL